MGFTTGLLGGFTLTASILYLTTRLHTQNRVHQASLLRQQALLLNNIVEPQPPPPPPTSREVKVGLWETAKDKWNSELESNVRKLQRTNWGDVRERMEETVSGLWSKAFQSGREGVEIGVDKANEGVQFGVKKANEGVQVGLQKAQEGVQAGVEKARAAVK